MAAGRRRLRTGVASAAYGLSDVRHIVLWGGCSSWLLRLWAVDDEEAIRILEERVLISLTLCWEISPGNPDGYISIAVPPELQRK